MCVCVRVCKFSSVVVFVWLYLCFSGFACQCVLVCVCFWVCVCVCVSECVL